MELMVSVDGADSADELRSLYEWLSGEEDLRGHVRPVQSSPEPGTMGSVQQTLIVVLGPGSGAVFASAVVAWLRYRTSDVVFKVTRKDGTPVELAASRVRGTDLAALGELSAKLSQSLDEGEQNTPAIQDV
jgi:Effector Associated Constant Component 1